MENVLEKIITEPLKGFLQKIAKFLPNLFSALIVFVIGLVLAWGVKVVIVKLLKLLKFDALCDRMGVSETLKKMAVTDSPVRLLGRFFYWLTVIIFFVISLYLLELPTIEHLLEKLLLYLPNIMIAAIILVVGFVLGNFLGRATLIASVNAGIDFAGILSRTIKSITILLAFVMAMEQLGIARSTVIAAFAIVFGGLILALSLAFGLGGQEIARKYLEGRFKPEGREKENEIKHI
ncbi:MAG: hypothetical protein AB1558_00190 [Thermodesulfobacteriota bacterium]